MTISLRATATGSLPNSVSNTVWTVTLPSFQAGDVVVVDFWGPFNGALVNTPSGWTQIAQDNTGGGGAGTGQCLARYYRVMQAGDSSTVTWTATYGAPWTWVASSWLGVNNASPIDGNGAVSRTATTNGVTTGHGSAMLLPMWTNNTAFSILSNPVGTTRVAYATSTDTWSRGVDTESKLAGTAGAVAGIAMPDTNNTWQASHLFALNAQAPPLAPTPTNPAPASSQNLAAGFTFNWTYNPATSGVAQTAYAFRRKVGAGAYEWWNAGTLAWQSTEIFNTSTTPAVTFGSGKWTNGTAYTWSVATQDSNGTGAYSADTAVTGSTPPVVTVTGPPNPVAGATPSVTWTEVLQAGSVQTAYRVVIESGAFGATPGSGVTVWDSGVVLSTALSATVGVALANGGSYRAFVIVTQTGAQSSPWTTRDFTVTYNTPGTPSIVAVWDSTLARCAISVQNRENMLGTDQSSLETGTTGWMAYGNCTVTRSTAQATDGSASLALTAVAAGDMTAGPPGSNVANGSPAVVPGKAYVAVASFRAATQPRQVSVELAWYNGNTWISQTLGARTADNASGWQQASALSTAPPNATNVEVILHVFSAGAAGEVHYVDRIGITPLGDLTPEGYGPNLVFDGDFENGLGYWAPSSNCTVAVSQTQAYTGRYSLAITSTASGGADAYPASTSYRVVAGKTYTASVYVRANTTARSWQFLVNWYNASNSFIGQSSGALTAATNSGWTRITCTAAAPAGAAFAGLFPIVKGSASGEVHFIDAVKLEAGSAATTYVPDTYTNLIPNPSFEVDATWWNPVSTQALSTTTAWAAVGTRSLVVTSAGTNQDCYATYNLSPGSGTITVSATGYVPAPMTGALDTRARAIQIYTFDAAGSLVAGYNSAALANTAGATGRLSVSAPVPTNGRVEVRLYNGSATAGEAMWWDAVQAEYGTVANPYVDGSQGPGYSWDVSGNMLSAQDSSFEGAGIGFWSVGTNWTATNSTATAYDGTHSLRATRANSTAGNGYVYINVAVAPLTTYTVSVWIRASAATPFGSRVDYSDAAHAYLSSSASYTVTGVVGSYIRVAYSFTTPANTAYINWLLYDDPNGAPTAGSWLDIDAAQVEQRSYATPLGSNGAAGWANTTSSSRRTPWTVGGFAGLTQTVVEESEDGGVTWARVRQLVSADTSTQLVTVYDYEAAPGVTRIYRASVRANWTNPATLVTSRYSASSASIVATLLSAWLKDPLDPASNVALSCLDGITDTKGRNVAVLLPLGAKLPIVQSDVRRARTATVSVTPATQAETDAINHLLDQPARVLLLQQPAAKSPWRGRQMYLVATGDDTSAPIGDVPADNRTMSFPVAEVRAPAVV